MAVSDEPTYPLSTLKELWDIYKSLRVHVYRKDGKKIVKKITGKGLPTLDGTGAKMDFIFNHMEFPKFLESVYNGNIDIKT